MAQRTIYLEIAAVVAAIIVIAVVLVYAVDRSVPNQLSRIPDQAAYEQGLETGSIVKGIMKIVVAIAVLPIIALQLFEHVKLSGYFRKKKAGG